MTCPAARVSLDTLTQVFSPYFPNFSKTDLARLLRHQLGSPYDDSYESISRAEASWFVLEAQADLRQGPIPPWRQIMMSGLQKIFFQGRIDWHAPSFLPKFPTQIQRCADGDTCHAVILEDVQCPPLQETLRFSAVDTPESFYSFKLARVRDEVTQKLIQSQGLPPSLASRLQPLVQYWIQYLGRLSGLVMKDFEGWLQAQGGSFAVSDSYVNTPNKYQGLWQGYGTYLRRIVTLHAPLPAISQYFQVRLPVLMATEGRVLYREALQEYRELYQQNRVPLLPPASLPDPARLYTPKVGAYLAGQWQSDDWTAALIFSGLAYYYPKYKNQNGDFYNRIQDRSQAMGIGLWQDLIFRLMDPKVSVPDPTPDPDV